jgi:hypothetical protein
MSGIVVCDWSKCSSQKPDKIIWTVAGTMVVVVVVVVVGVLLVLNVYNLRSVGNRSVGARPTF